MGEQLKKNTNKDRLTAAMLWRIVSRVLGGVSRPMGIWAAIREIGSRSFTRNTIRPLDMSMYSNEAVEAYEQEIFARFADQPPVCIPAEQVAKLLGILTPVNHMTDGELFAAAQKAGMNASRQLALRKYVALLCSRDD